MLRIALRSAHAFCTELSKCVWSIQQIYMLRPMHCVTQTTLAPSTCDAVTQRLRSQALKSSSGAIRALRRSIHRNDCQRELFAHLSEDVYRHSSERIMRSSASCGYINCLSVSLLIWLQNILECCVHRSFV